MAIAPVQVPVSTSVPTLTLAAGSAGGLAVASTIDPVNDYLSIYTASSTATQGINRNTLLGISSAPVGLTDSQTLTNKTLTSPTISGPTLSGTIGGTYTIGGTPTFPSSVVTLTGTQTLTNKTLTSPSMSAPTITNATISADALTGFTTSNTGTIYGVSVTAGVINGANTIGNAALQTNAVQANQLSASAITLGYAQTTSNFSTANTSATQITGLTTTVTIPSGSRKIKITAFASDVYSATAAAFVTMTIWDGTVGSGTQLARTQMIASAASNTLGAIVIAVVTPSAGSKTYNIGLATSSGSDAANMEAAATYPAFILVEAI